LVINSYFKPNAKYNHPKVYFKPLHVSSTCAHRQEGKNVIIQSLYHHTETREWSKLLK